MMHMTFYWGKGVTLLFDQWITRTWLQYTLSLLVLFAAGIVHEWLSRCSSRVVRNLFSSPAKSQEVPLLSEQRHRHGHRLRAYRGWVKTLEALVFGINVAFSYLLMLAIMSFNGGVFISIVLGHTVGYCLFHSDSDPETSGHSCA